MDFCILLLLVSIIYSSILSCTFANTDCGSCHSICNEINGGITVDRNISYQRCIGPPGQNGSLGLKGEPGTRGPPGQHCLCEEYKNLLSQVEFLREELEVFKKHSKMEFSEWKKAKNGMWYRLYEDRANWEQAKLNCEAENARLPSTGMRNRTIRKEVFRGLPRTIKYLWLGFNDIQQEGRWVWSDNVELFDFYWRGGEPNNAWGVEDCARLRIESHETGKITVNDLPCTQMAITSRYICEYVP
uniref:collectin-11-like n=1 Tax=Styela clava TaxID=7725 RepID=UPI00193ABD2A|nr:collectin-11-like [Styela clava]